MANDTIQAQGIGSNTALQSSAVSPPIADLLLEWTNSVQGYVSNATGGDDTEWRRLVAASDAVRDALMGIPALSVEDLAVKAYLAAHHKFGGAGPNYLGIDWTGEGATDGYSTKALIADALRLSPTLRLAVGAS